MLSRLNTHTYPYLAFALSLSLLCGAWFFQYGLGYAPCQMCYWQRHAHKAVIAAAILAIIAPRLGINTPRLLNIIVIIALVASAGLALWHVGVEYKWWEGPQSCAAGAGNLSDFNPEDLLASLSEKIKPPACSDIVWGFLGLSMAGWNMVFSALGAILGLLTLRKPVA